MVEEIWKDVVGYEGLYEISNLGNLRSCGKYVWNRFSYCYRDGKIMKQNIDRYGYSRAILSKDGYQKNKQIHRLVAEAFIDNPYNLPEVNHKDCNKTNNNVDNLEWITGIENTRHAIANGRMHYDEIETPVIQIDYKTGRVINKYKSIAEVNRLLGYHIGNISLCCKGSKFTSNGFAWQYNVNDNDVGDIVDVLKPEHNPRYKRKVAKLSMDNTILQFYDSIIEAANENNCSDSSISMCCKGRLAQHHNFKWRYRTSDMKIGDVVNN
jgi:hypothetical protein